MDRAPLTNRFANMGGKSLNSTNCASFIAGIIEGILCSAKLFAKVTAHLYGDEEEAQAAAGTKESQTATTTT